VSSRSFDAVRGSRGSWWSKSRPRSSTLARGAPLAEAVERVREEDAQRVFVWLKEWVSAGLFAAVELAEEEPRAST